MANWANVEDGLVVGVYDILPKNWKNVSGLNLASDDTNFLKSVGWYPIEKESISFDETTHKISHYDYSLDTDVVTETPIVVEKEIEINNFESLKLKFLGELRQIRNELLQQTDWTQLMDVQSNMEQSDKDKWINYRQQLRDMLFEYSENDVVDLNNVNWPIL